MPLLEV